METYDFTRPVHYTVCAFIIKGNKILFLKQNRSTYWMLPGGHIEDNELPHEAVIREVKEETGLKISLLQKPNKKYRTKIVTPMPMPYDLRVMPCNDGKKRDVDFVYTAKILAGKLKINNESTEAKWLSRKEIKTDSRIGPWTKLHALKLI